MIVRILRVVLAVCASLLLCGCGQQPTNKSSTSNNESVLAELKKQNEMLEAQGKKQQAETSANDKNEKKESSYQVLREYVCETDR